MITVEVVYHNMLRHRTGTRSETLTLPAGAKLFQALEQIGEHHGPGVRNLLMSPDGDIASHIVIFCNDRLVHGDRAGLLLSQGDQLLLFPAISGG